MADLTVTGEVVVTSEKAEAAFDRVGDKATQMANEVASAAGKAGQAVDGVGAGAEKSADKFTRAESRMRDAIKRSTQELQLLGKTASEKLEFNIQAKGLDASKFAPYIEELKKAEAAQRIATGSLDKMGVSAAQTAAALRGVPAQFTDIITSLQGGQAPLTVFLQQGGQLKDMFGGAGAAARALGGYVVGLINPFTLAAAGAAALAVAYSQGSKEADAYRTALVTTGNAAGTTAGQLKSYAQEISTVVGTQGKAAESLAAFVSTGRVSRDVLKEASQAAIAWERATGQAVSTTAKQFADLGKDPLQAVLKLNEGTNFLTESVYRQIKSLDEQGRTAEAAAVAQRAYADALTGRAGEIERNLGSIETAWNKVKDAAKGGWDAILNVGRAETNQDRLAATRKQIADLENRLAAGSGFSVTAGGAATGRPDAANNARLQAQLLGLQAQAAALEGVAFAAKTAAEAEAERAKQMQATAAWDKEGAKYLTDKAKLERDLTAARNEGLAAGKSQAEIEQRLAEIRESYSKKGAAAAKAEQSAYATLIASVRAKIAQNEMEIATGGKLNEAEKLRLKLTAELEAGSRKLSAARRAEAEAELKRLDASERALAVFQAQKKFEAERDKETASIADQISKINGKAQSLEDEAAAYGKTADELRALTVDRLNEQKAVLMGFDGSEQRIDMLNQEIEAVQRLGKAETTIADRKLGANVDEVVRAAQAQADAYQEEWRFAGMTAVERAKIVAERKIELDYAKRIADVDKSGASDEAKARARDNLRAAERQDKKVAGAKAVADEWQRTADSINQSLTDALLRGFESGKDFAKNMRDTVINMFKTMVLRPVISAVVNPIAGAVTGALGIGGGGGTGSSIMGGIQTASNLNTLWGAGSQALWGGTAGASAASLGYANIVGMAGGDAIGALAAANGMWAGVATGAQAAAQAAIASNAAMAAGTAAALPAGTTAAAAGAGAGGASGALAAIPGWGWALAGVATLAALWDDGSGTLHTGAKAQYSAADGLATTGEGGKKEYGLNIGMVYDKNTADFVGGVAKGLTETFDGLAVAFGQKAGYQVATAFADDTSKDGAWGALRISKDGKDLLNWEDTRTSRWAPKEFADGEAGQKEYLAAIAKDTRTVLLDMDLPSWADTMLESIGDSASMDQLTGVLTQIGVVQSAFVALGKSMEMFSGLTDEMQSGLLAAAGSIEALTAGAGAFYQGFYSEQERVDAAVAQLNEALAGLDLSIDPTLGDDAKAQFRAEVEKAFAAGDADLAAGLLSISGNFASAADYFEQLSQSAADAAAQAAEQAAQMAEQAAQMAERQAAEQASIAGDLRRQILELTGDTAAIRQLEIAGMNAANVALYDRVQALQAEAEQSSIRADLERQMLELTGDTAAIRQLEIAGMDAVNVALYDRVQALQSEAQAAEAAAQAAKTLADSRFGLENRLLVQSGQGAYVQQRIDQRDLAELTKGLPEEQAAKVREQFEANLKLRDQYEANQLAADNLAAAMGQLKEQQDAATQAQKDMLQSTVTSAKKAVDDLRSIFDFVGDAIKELRGDVVSTAGMQAEQARAFIQRASVLMRSGTVVDSGQLQAAIRTASGSVQTGAYASQFEADNARLLLANELAGLQDGTAGQLTVAEKHLSVAEQQLNALNVIAASINSLASAQAVTAGQPRDQWARVQGQDVYASSGGAVGINTGSDIDIYGKDGSRFTGSEAIAFVRNQVAVNDEASVYAEATKTGISAKALDELMGWAAGTSNDWAKANGLPQFAVGTNYVPRDMVAQIHEGEAIVPKAFNPWANGMTSSNPETERLLQQLVADNRVQAGEIVRLNTRIAKLMERWDGEGLPQARSEAAV